MNTEQATQSTKKSVMAFIAVVVVLLVLGAFLAWYTSPRRTLNNFLSAIENRDEATVEQLVSTSLKKTKQENIEWFTEDWLIATSIEAEFEQDESWRSRVVMIEENGELVPKMNKHGYEENELKPTPKYLAHHYEAEVTVTFGDGEDEYEDPVVIKLKRDTEDTWSPFAQLFRGWKVTNIKYQPLDDEDFEELEFGEDDFVDISGADGEFELDENGELVFPDEEEDIEDAEDDGEETVDEEELLEDEDAE